MSFGDRAFTETLDYGDSLPRRLRRAIAWVLLGLMVLAPRTHIGLVTRYAEQRAHVVVELMHDFVSEAPLQQAP